MRAGWRAGGPVSGRTPATYPCGYRSARAGLAGAPLGKNKPLDGLNVWRTISEGKPSPRTEIVYNVEPFRAGSRDGDWKLIWRTPLHAAVELYDIARDPSEKNNIAAAHPDKVAALQKRANELAATMAKPLLLQAEAARCGSARTFHRRFPARKLRLTRRTSGRGSDWTQWGPKNPGRSPAIPSGTRRACGNGPTPWRGIARCWSNLSPCSRPGPRTTVAHSGRACQCVNYSASAGCRHP